jgi:hypothetical protein
MKDDLAESASYTPDAARYGEDAFLPSSVAELSAIGRARDLLLGGVRLFPLQFNPATRTLRRYSRIVVEVTYGPGSGLQAMRDGDRVLAGVPLNAPVARTWGSTAKTGLAAPPPSVLASGEWYRLSVSDEGMYRLDATYLSSLGINLSLLDPRTIKIYGNGGQEVPEDVTRPRVADLAENAIYVAGESDGKFDAGDYLLFFGTGTRGWTYDPAGRTIRHYIHRYSEVNYYWLTFGGTAGKRMASQASLPSSPTDMVMDKFTDGIAVEEEKVNLLGSGKDWYGQSLSPGGSFTYMSTLPGLAANEVIRYRYNLVAHSEALPTYTVRQNGAIIGAHGLSPTSGYTYATGATFEVSGSSSLPAATSQLNFQFNSPSVAGNGWIDWVEIIFPRMLWAAGDNLGFRGPDASAVVEYRLQQFTAAPMVFNVSSHANVRLVSGVSGSFLFRAAETAGSPSFYYAVAGNSWRLPRGASKMPNQNIRGYADGADFIIVTSAEFRSAADRLKAYRETAAHGGLRTYVADVNLVYNEFSGGVPDVAAIRDFLKYAHDTWIPRPQFVLFLGQGSYDYKGILGTRSNYVPTWQSDESRDDVDSYCTDDFFAKFGGGNTPSLVLGRISSRTGAEAEAFLNKLRRYEETPVPDSWKMRMLYIGDDAWTPEGGEVGDRTLHSDDTEFPANQRRCRNSRRIRSAASTAPWMTCKRKPSSVP